MCHLQQSSAYEFGSLHWNHVLELSCLLTTTTTSPSNTIFSSIPCSSPHFEGYPLFLCSSTPLQEQEGISSGVDDQMVSILLFLLKRCLQLFFQNQKKHILSLQCQKEPKGAVIATTMWETAVVRAYTQKHAKSQSPWRRLYHSITSISRVNVGGGSSSV